MLISVLIPNYNGKDLLERNLPKVYEEMVQFCSRKKEKVEIIIIDDASTDESVSYLSEKIKDFSNKYISSRFIENKNNLGFSRTINIGASVATGDFLLLLNSDVYPEGSFLEPLLSRMDEAKVFAVGCLDKSKEGQEVVQRGRGIGRWREGFLMHEKGEITHDNTLWVSGGSGLFRRSIWEKLSGFDDIYSPFYWEDIDLSYRALKSGYSLIFAKESTVVHEHEKGAIKKERTKKEVESISYRNQILFVWTNISDMKLLIIHFLWIPVHLLRSVKDSNTSFLRGFFLAVLQIPNVIKSRRRNKKLWKVSDHLIMSQFSL